ncbi:MAG: Hsp20/alpha crystallin family protein [Actinobacteria bacterium]|nr:Hsp20/alpha crystallin family protein [Actinomycetota bacterium]
MTLVIRAPYRRYCPGDSRTAGWLINFPLPGQDRDGRSAAWNPEVEVSDGDDELRFRVDLGETKREDIDVRVADGVLTLNGSQTKKHRVEREGQVWLQEYRASFCRSFVLPESIQPDRTEATFAGGVLEVSMSKKESREKPHRIEVRSAGEGARKVQINREPES